MRNIILNERDWYAATVDEGIVSGPYRTKRRAMNETTGTSHLTTMHRIHAGLYRDAPYGAGGRGYYVGTGHALEISGFNWELENDEY